MRCFQNDLFADSCLNYSLEWYYSARLSTPRRQCHWLTSHHSEPLKQFQNHQFTQYSGVRPFGVALIIAGIDRKGVNVYVIDPSGTYNSYSAIAIGTGSDEVNEFLEKNYKDGLTIDEAASLAIAAINLKSEEKSGIEHIKMSKILSEGKMIEKISTEDLKKFDEAAKGKFVK